MTRIEELSETNRETETRICQLEKQADMNTLGSAEMDLLPQKENPAGGFPAG